MHGTVSVHEWGTFFVACKGEGNSVSIITPKDVLFVPQLRVNLLCVRKLRQVDFIPVYNEEHGEIIIKEHFWVSLSYPLEYNSARVGA